MSNFVADITNEMQNAGYAPDSFLTKTFIKIARIESGGNYFAKSPTSTATGLFQFTEATWHDNAPAGANIHEPKAQVAAMLNLAHKHIHYFTTHCGMSADKITAGDLYLANFGGEAGAGKVISADQSTPIMKLFGPSVIKANATIRHTFNVKDSSGKEHQVTKSFAQFTAGDLRDWANAHMGVDVDARYAYAERHNEGKTTAEDDADEYKQRVNILHNFGETSDQLKAIPKDQILGGLFFVILAALLTQSMPSTAKNPDAATALLNRSQVDPVVSAPVTAKPAPVAALQTDAAVKPVVEAPAKKQEVAAIVTPSTPLAWSATAKPTGAAPYTPPVAATRIAQPPMPAFA